MGRKRSRNRDMVRLDLSQIEIHTTLMEDLRKYIGSPKNYIPGIWDMCVDVLREEETITLNELTNSTALDGVWNDLFDSFDEDKFRNIVRTEGLSVRLSGFRDNVTDFLYDVFFEIYPQVAAFVDKRMDVLKDAGMYKNYRIDVVEVFYEDIYDGFSTVEIETGCSVRYKEENYISKRTLRGNGYEF